MKNPQISIIVPIYNVEKLLPRCMDSILNQSFQDFELLLIDDGSKDNSGKICDEYAMKDKRIRVFHKENGGPASARNVGLENSRGEYIAFSDADDWMEEEWLNSMIREIEEVDLVITGFIEHEGNGNVEIKELKGGTFSKEDYSRVCTYLLSIEQMGYLWTMLFKNRIIRENNIKFDENLRMQEDLVFIMRYIEYAKNIKTTSSCLYHYYFVFKPSYKVTLYLFNTIMPLYERILSQKTFYEFKYKYIRTLSMLLLDNCKKNDFLSIKELLFNCPNEFKSVSIYIVRMIICYFPYPIAYPMLKSYYYIRKLKLIIFGEKRTE